MKGLLFTYGLTFGGAAVAIVHPFYGLLAYLTFAVLRPELIWPWSVPPGNYSRIVGIALLVGWALRGFGNWNFRSAWPFALALFGYVGWFTLSAMFAENQAVAWNFVVLHSKILLPVLVGLTLIETETQLKQLTWVLVLSLGFLAFEGNLDHFTGGFRVRNDGLGGMDNNSFCIAMAAASGLAFFFGLQQRSWLLRLLCFAIAAMAVHTTMFGNSRGGMLGVGVVAIVTVYFIPKRPLELSLVAVSALVGLRLAGPAVWERFSSITIEREALDESADSRLRLWADCWDVMQRYPITGIGPDHWPLAAPSYGWLGHKECHSVWFNAGAEFGFPGLFFFICLYATVIWGLWRVLWRGEAEGTWTADNARMVVAALAGFLVSASFVSLDGLEPPYFIAMLGAATLKVYSLYGATAPALAPPPPNDLYSTPALYGRLA